MAAESPGPPRIGLALGGGGARGYAHVGVLQVLEESGIRPDVVAGTSIGALVGAAYLGGSLAQLTAEMLGIRLHEIPTLLSPSWSLSGLFSGRTVLEKISAHLGTDRIENLPRPFATVAVDIQTGTPTTFSRGDIKKAIRASLSIPGLSTPVMDGERVLVDGGVMEPLPVRATRELGADIVIAVDLFGESLPLPPPAEPKRDQGLAAHLQSAVAYLRARVHGEYETEDTGRAETSTKPLAAPNLLEVIERTSVINQRQLTGRSLGNALHPASGAYGDLRGPLMASRGTSRNEKAGDHQPQSDDRTGGVKHYERQHGGLLRIAQKGQQQTADERQRQNEQGAVKDQVLGAGMDTGHQRADCRQGQQCVQQCKPGRRALHANDPSKHIAAQADCHDE